MTNQQRRGALERTRRPLGQGALTVGFSGGSLIDARPGWNWPGPLWAWFVENCPGVRLRGENAVIGATGSALAVWHAQGDLIHTRDPGRSTQYTSTNFDLALIGVLP